MQPALAQVSTLQASFESDVADYAAGHCPAIELWLGKLETYLETHSIDQVRDLLAEHEMAAPVASFQGGLFMSPGDARSAHWEHFIRRLALCRDLGVETLVVAADISGRLAQADLDRVGASLAEAARKAEQHGVRLALEFQARATLCNNLETAAALMGETASEHLGICLDVFHYHTGASKTEDLGYLTRENLFHVQLCDLAGQVRELAADADRVLPGDGDILLAPIIDRLRAIDYPGHVSVELMNPHIWQVPPLQFGEIAMTALRKTLGQASMGDSP